MGNGFLRFTIDSQHENLIEIYLLSVCDVGETRDNSTCVLCEVGTFKDTTGDQPCSQCPTNATTVMEGSTFCGGSKFNQI